MDDSIPRAIAQLKNEFMRRYKKNSILCEIIPLSYSERLPIADEILQSLHQFASANPMYFKSYKSRVLDIDCQVYEGDISNYWLNSKKHDTSYQPFYPTWMLSACTLALGARSLGFEQVVDVGSGDGRIAHCATLLGMKSYGIEIDDSLIQLQKSISSATGVSYNAIKADATRFNYGVLELTKPMFFISGLPEMGEMLANSVIHAVMSLAAIKCHAGFNFMGSHVMKSLSRDKTGWGWGKIIEEFDLEQVDVMTLPTLWTADQVIDTAYVYTKCK
jgi:hypothetical protein